MAFEMYIRTAWEVVREDFRQIYNIATPILSRPCLNFLNILSFVFVFGQIFVLTIMVLFFIRHCVGKMGWPVRKTMHGIYMGLAAVGVLQIFMAPFFIVFTFQGVLVLFFISSVGQYILDP
ncbi:unnamed protein product [Caenorhabditis brenneri]